MNVRAIVAVLGCLLVLILAVALASEEADDSTLDAHPLAPMPSEEVEARRDDDTVDETPVAAVESPLRVEASKPLPPRSTAKPATIRFRYLDSKGRPVGDQRVTIVAGFPDELDAATRTLTSGDDGWTEAVAVLPGTLRWMRASGLLVTLDPAPKPRAASITPTEGGFLISGGGDDPRLSGPIIVHEGEEIERTIQVRPGASVHGTITSAGLCVPDPIALKVVQRIEIAGLRAGSPGLVDFGAVEMVHLGDGRFRIDDLEAGSMELIAWWRDGFGGLHTATHSFELGREEVKDLGRIEEASGESVEVTIRIVDQDGEPIDAAAITAHRPMQRVFEADPDEPYPAWPHQSFTVPIDEPFVINGLRRGGWRFSTALFQETRLGDDPSFRSFIERYRPLRNSVHVDVPGSTNVELREVWERVHLRDVVVFDPERLTDRRSVEIMALKEGLLKPEMFRATLDRDHVARTKIVMTAAPRTYWAFVRNDECGGVDAWARVDAAWTTTEQPLSFVLQRPVRCSGRAVWAKEPIFSRRVIRFAADEFPSFVKFDALLGDDNHFSCGLPPIALSCEYSETSIDLSSRQPIDVMVSMSR